MKVVLIYKILLNPNLDSLLQYLEDVDKRATENENKYKTKPIRRAFLIDTNANQYDETKKETKFALDCIKVITICD